MQLVMWQQVQGRCCMRWHGPLMGEKGGWGREMPPPESTSKSALLASGAILTSKDAFKANKLQFLFKLYLASHGGWASVNALGKFFPWYPQHIHCRFSDDSFHHRTAVQISVFLLPESYKIPYFQMQLFIPILSGDLRLVSSLSCWQN